MLLGRPLVTEPKQRHSSTIMNSDNIFGTFRPLTAAQIKDNAKFVALWSAPFLICIVGVVVAVKTGIVWIGAASGAICVSALIFVASLRNVKYVPAFGMKYNLLRVLICGLIIYGGVAWRSLLGFYFHLNMKYGSELSISSFAWMVMALSCAIMAIARLSLFRIVDVYVADIVGIIEVLALSGFIGSIMFMLLYA